jgi:hypothetical protein
MLLLLLLLLLLRRPGWGSPTSHHQPRLPGSRQLCVPP